VHLLLCPPTLLLVVAQCRRSQRQNCPLRGCYGHSAVQVVEYERCPRRNCQPFERPLFCNCGLRMRTAGCSQTSSNILSSNCGARDVLCLPLYYRELVRPFFSKKTTNLIKVFLCMGCADVKCVLVKTTCRDVTTICTAKHEAYVSHFRECASAAIVSTELLNPWPPVFNKKTHSSKLRMFHRF
jgi:hypothetical protein